jgi:V8-like Glu-specific endopeptidase
VAIDAGQDAVARGADAAGARFGRAARGTTGSAGEAGITTKSVIGDDDRLRVGAGRYPFRAVFRVVSNFGHLEQGSAFLVGPRTLLTAGHCMVQATFGTRASTLEVFDEAGRRHAVSDWNCLPGWSSARANASDLGYIHLREPVGGTLGYFGTRTLEPAEAVGDCAVSGYPLDLDHGQRQYCALGRIAGMESAFLRYDVDTEGGQSGAPLFYTADGIATALGVHIQGVGAHGPGNLALRFTPQLVLAIRDWAR